MACRRWTLPTSLLVSSVRLATRSSSRVGLDVARIRKGFVWHRVAAHCRTASPLPYTASRCYASYVEKMKRKREEEEGVPDPPEKFQPKSKKKKKIIHNEPAVFTMRGITKQLPNKRPLFTDVSVNILRGAKIGVIGANGAGKSSLLKIMAGIDSDYDGEAAAVPSTLKIGLLSQEPELDPSKTVWENIFEAVSDKVSLIERLEEINNELEESGQSRALLREKSEIEDQLEEMGLSEYTSADQFSWRIKRAMNALRSPPEDALVESLSGGERRRVALCRLLCSQPDILLLDEPTNHLDADSVAWLERFLSEYRGTVLAVTHDRYFLDNVAEWMLEVDRGNLYAFEGNYSGWLVDKKIRLELEQKRETARTKHIERELDWLNNRPRGRKRKNKARVRAYEDLLKEAKVTPPQPGRIVIPPGPRLGNIVIEAHGLTKSIEGRVLFQNLSFSIPPGSIVGIIGSNGCGKTTLLRILSGEEDPDAGEVVLGATVKLGYVPQLRSNLSDNNTVYDEISEGTEQISLGNSFISTRLFVAAFNFQGEMQQRSISVLSGGERNRVHLAKMVKSAPNVILLDEPTNDLDVDVLSNLENAIADFAGSALIVTHDRWFLDRLCTDILAFEEDGNVTFFNGNYSDYVIDREERLGKKEQSKFVKIK